MEGAIIIDTESDPGAWADALRFPPHIEDSGREVEFVTGPTVAALYVEDHGCYYAQPGVEAWPAFKDARRYQGPHPVVAHPPCQRWGRFWHGSTRKPHQYQLGDDGGCGEAAVASVRTHGGVMEHPADSLLFAHCGLPIPKRGQGWTEPDEFGGRSCYVEQGNYGHESRKPTWLYAVGVNFAELDWSRGEQRIPQWMLDRYGYEQARRIGVVAMVGGKNKTRKRNATPPAFRDLLLSIARTASPALAGRTPGHAKQLADPAIGVLTPSHLSTSITKREHGNA